MHGDEKKVMNRLNVNKADVLLQLERQTEKKKVMIRLLMN